jgi:hypothetical protein
MYRWDGYCLSRGSISIGCCVDLQNVVPKVVVDAWCCIRIGVLAEGGYNVKDLSSGALRL